MKIWSLKYFYSHFIPLPLIQEEQFISKECTLKYKCTGKLPLGGLPRNGVVRITDLPDMTQNVYCGSKASNQAKDIFCLI